MLYCINVFFFIFKIAGCVDKLQEGGTKTFKSFHYEEKLHGPESSISLHFDEIKLI